MAALILALLENHENANEVKACLEECGHEVFVVDKFTKAIEILCSRKIDLILSDVHLENGGSVFDFLRRVKKGPNTSEIPFILFSLKPTPLAKHLADGVRTSARYLGSVKYIEMEVFNPAEFKEHINSLLSPEKQPADRDKDLKLVNKIGE
jgi:CheY-like chemotaxis protein